MIYYINLVRTGNPRTNNQLLVGIVAGEISKLSETQMSSLRDLICNRMAMIDERAWAGNGKRKNARGNITALLGK